MYRAYDAVQRKVQHFKEVFRAFPITGQMVRGQARDNSANYLGDSVPEISITAGDID